MENVLPVYMWLLRHSQLGIRRNLETLYVPQMGIQPQGAKRHRGKKKEIKSEHWLGERAKCDSLTKRSIYDDTIDDKEFEGDLISLLKFACNFVNVNSKVHWKKVANGRINKPDYIIIGSKERIDMYDDRIEICSSRGMYDGTMIQELDIEQVSSRRKNPYIADVFHRLNNVERRGSSLKKI
ncbi:MAG: ATP-binding protein [Lachnospiraceae bacterium]